MGGRIEIYCDISSLFSYVAFQQLRGTRKLLGAHQVEVDIIPVFLGAINHGSGNKPPWSLPAKARYGRYDSARSLKACGLKEIDPPADLMAVANTVVPLRALHYIKRHHDRSTYLSTWQFLLQTFWGPSADDKPRLGDLGAVLRRIPRGYDGPEGAVQAGSEGAAALFTDEEIRKIIAATKDQEYKDLLKGVVDEALSRGAFGAPWMWVTNFEGRSEPFFGSDRWHFVYDFLQLPYLKTALLPPGGHATETSKL